MPNFNTVFDSFPQAFQNAANEVTVKNAKTVLVTEEYYDKAIEFIREHYTKCEPISKALGLKWNEEQRKFWLGALKDELTPMFIDETTGDVMAIRYKYDNYKFCMSFIRIYGNRKV